MKLFKDLDVFDREGLVNSILGYKADYLQQRPEQKKLKDTEWLMFCCKDSVRKAVKEEIKQSVWAFVPSFILPYIDENIELRDLEKMQKELCEGANEIVLSLIGNRLDDFIDDAIEADGAGHFLAQYDHKEIKSNGKYFYRLS